MLIVWFTEQQTQSVIQAPQHISTAQTILRRVVRGKLEVRMANANGVRLLMAPFGGVTSIDDATGMDSDAGVLRPIGCLAG